MSRALIIFSVVCLLIVGGVFVYAKNNFKPATHSANNQYKLNVLGSSTNQIKNPNNNVNTPQITELKIEDEREGTGSAVKSGDTVEVNYIGTLLDGTKFDSSYDRGQTFSFTVGAENVIQGWDQGLVGMKIGGKRKLTIPASLGYGSQGAGTIPPNSPLIFEIELVSIK